MERKRERPSDDAQEDEGGEDERAPKRARKEDLIEEIEDRLDPDTLIKLGESMTLAKWTQYMISINKHHYDKKGTGEVHNQYDYIHMAVLRYHLLHDFRKLSNKDEEPEEGISGFFTSLLAYIKGPDAPPEMREALTLEWYQYAYQMARLAARLVQELITVTMMHMGEDVFRHDEEIFHPPLPTRFLPPLFLRSGKLAVEPWTLDPMEASRTTVTFRESEVFLPNWSNGQFRPLYKVTNGMVDSQWVDLGPGDLIPMSNLFPDGGEPVPHVLLHGITRDFPERFTHEKQDLLPMFVPNPLTDTLQEAAARLYFLGYVGIPPERLVASSSPGGFPHRNLLFEWIGSAYQNIPVMREEMRAPRLHYSEVADAPEIRTTELPIPDYLNRMELAGDSLAYVIRRALPPPDLPSTYILYDHVEYAFRELLESQVNAEEEYEDRVLGTYYLSYAEALEHVADQGTSLLQNVRMVLQPMDAMAFIGHQTGYDGIGTYEAALYRLVNQLYYRTPLLHTFWKRKGSMITAMMRYFFGDAMGTRDGFYQSFMYFIDEKEVRQELRGDPAKWRFYSSSVPQCSFCATQDVAHVIKTAHKAVMACTTCMHSS